MARPDLAQEGDVVSPRDLGHGEEKTLLDPGVLIAGLVPAGGDEHESGRGIPDDSAWEPEESMLAIGVSREEALSLGRRFGQNAVVWGERGGGAELFDCRSKK